MDHGLRRTRLAERLGELGVDALLVTRLPNVRYLTGFTGSNGQLLIGTQGHRFFTDGRYIEQIGTFNPILPKDNAERVKLDLDRCKHWLSVGAQPTDRVQRLFDGAGLLKREARNNPEKAKPKKKAQERAAAKAKAAEDAAAAGGDA